MNHDLDNPRPAPAAWVLGADDRLFRFFEIELAHLGLMATVPSPEAPDGDTPPALIVADSDTVPLDALPPDVPLLAYGYEPVELPAERGIRLRRPFPLPALEDALRRLSAPVTTTAAPLRQARVAPEPTPAADDVLALDTEAALVTVGGHRVTLTPAELAILSRLWASRGEPVSRDELSTLLGGGGNSVDVYICHLRRKIEKPLGRRMITTVRGRGYVLE